jgi:hypothetical protein
MNRRFLVVSGLLAAIACAPLALGAGPLGPPTATLKQGQFGIALEYAYNDSDLELSLGTDDTTWKGAISNTFLAQLGYGLTDDWEIYAPLGAANLKDVDLDCSYEFAYGFGTKITFEKTENTSWGLLFEIGWRKNNDSGIVDLTDLGLGFTTYTVDFTYNEIVVAVGPTWNVAEGMRVYGGPFFYVLEGDADVEAVGVDETLDVGQKPMFGGYVGVELDLCPNSSWYGEFQYTNDMMVFGTGVGWKF